MTQVYNLKVPGIEVIVRFRRLNDNRMMKGTSNKNPNFLILRGITECSLNEMESPNVVVFGYSFCMRTDKWNSQKGRHEAFQEALKEAGVDKETRGKLFEVFLQQERDRSNNKAARSAKVAA